MARAKRQPAREAEHKPDETEACAVTHQMCQHSARRQPERDTHTHLARALGDASRHHRVKADRRNQQCEESEEACHRNAGARGREPIRNRLLQRHGAERRQ